MSAAVLDVAFNRDGGYGVGPIRSERRRKSGRKSGGGGGGGGTKRLVPTTTETNMTSSSLMAGHPSLSYFPGTFAHPGLLAPAFTPRPPDEEEPGPSSYPPLTASSISATMLTSSNPRLSQTACPQQTQSTKPIDPPSMETHYIPSRIMSPIPTMRRLAGPHPILSPLSRPTSPPHRSRHRTTSPLASENPKQRPSRPRFPRSRIEPSLLRVALMTQLIKRYKASDDYDTIPLKGGAGGVVIMQKLSRTSTRSISPKYSEMPAALSGVLSG